MYQHTPLTTHRSMASRSTEEKGKILHMTQKPCPICPVQVLLLQCSASIFSQAQPHWPPFCLPKTVLPPSTRLWTCRALHLKYPTSFTLFTHSPTSRITFPGKLSFTPQINKGALLLTHKTASYFPLRCLFPFVSFTFNTVIIWTPCIFSTRLWVLGTQDHVCLANCCARGCT